MPDYADWHAKLLERANHPSTPLEEANACREKAGELAVKYGPFEINARSAYPEDFLRNMADDMANFWSKVYASTMHSPFTDSVRYDPNTDTRVDSSPNAQYTKPHLNEWDDNDRTWTYGDYE